MLDFGLVKRFGGGREAGLTRKNAIAGTPTYLAPETISAPDKVDGSVDIYGLGGVGYYLLAGKPMFAGTTVLELACHHLYTNPIPPTERRGAPIAPELEALVLACLAKDPADRPNALTEKLTHLSHRHRGARPNRQRGGAPGVASSKRSLVYPVLRKHATVAHPYPPKSCARRPRPSDRLGAGCPR